MVSSNKWLDDKPYLISIYIHIQSLKSPSGTFPEFPSLSLFKLDFNLQTTTEA